METTITTKFQPTPTTDTKQEISPCAIELLQRLDECGYKILALKLAYTDPKSYKYNYPNDWTASHKDRGIRIAIAQKNPTTIKFNITYRTRHGSYLKLADGYFGPTNSINICASNPPKHIIDTLNRSSSTIGTVTKEKLTECLCSIEGEKDTDNWKRKSDLPEPFEFCQAYTNEPFVDYINQCGFPIFGGSSHKTTLYKMNNFFSELMVIGPVVITNKLYVTSVGIEKPDADIWFVIQGNVINKNGEFKHAILVNSDITGYYALMTTNTGEFKITPNMKPNNEIVNFNMVSTIDKEMIERAIKYYMTTIT